MKIAIIGSGISGLGASLILSRRYETHLFEASGRLGGHANTVSMRDGENSIPVDTGFLVYNELNYPHLTALFKYLEVATVESEMTLSLRLDDKGIEWAGTNLNTVFAQRGNLLAPAFHGMLLAILRFHREAETNLLAARENGWTLGGLLRARRYPRSLASDYLLPMGAAIWSTPEEGMLNFPAETFLQFFINHRLLQVNNRPRWRTVKGGSVGYVNALARKLPHVHLNAPVREVERVNGKIILRVEGHGSAEFDRVVFATHAPVTARLLRGQSASERDVLGSFQVEPNTAVLHRDAAAMPRSRRCWTSWNAIGAPEGKASLTYYLNRLQPLGAVSDIFLSLNPAAAHDRVDRVISYDHPRFDFKAIRAQARLADLQGAGGVFYAGAWTRYGFHEDGLLSAVNVAGMLGEKPPWVR